MSKRKDKEGLCRVEGTGSMVKFRDLLGGHPVGQVADIVDRFMFLLHQHSLIVRNLLADWNRDSEAFFKTAGKSFLRMDRLRSKMKGLLRQMPSREAYWEDVEIILRILEEAVPGVRDKFAQRLKGRRKSRW